MYTDYTIKHNHTKNIPFALPNHKDYLFDPHSEYHILKLSWFNLHNRKKMVGPLSVMSVYPTDPHKTNLVACESHGSSNGSMCEQDAQIIKLGESVRGQNTIQSFRPTTQ